MLNGKIGNIIIERKDVQATHIKELKRFRLCLF